VTIVVANACAEEDRLELKCLSMGGPCLQYQWNRNGTDDFLTDTVTNTDTLIVTGLAAAEGGDFTCTVFNAAGSSTHMINLGESILCIPK